MNASLDDIRKGALDRADRSRRNVIFAMGFLALVELSVLVAILFIVDWKDRTHILVLLAAFWTISIVTLAMFALARHVSGCTRDLLRAREWAGEER